MVKGYVRFTECFGLRKPGRHRNTIIQEYPVGMELAVYDNTPDLELFVAEGVVDVFDAEHKRCKWSDLFPPQQRPVTVNEVEVMTKPVRKKGKK